MRGLDIGRTVRSGEYCDICKKTIYLNIWGHIEMHKRELQERENRRAAREASRRLGDAINGK